MLAAANSMWSSPRHSRCRQPARRYGCGWTATASMCCRRMGSRRMNEPVRVQKLKPSGEVAVEWTGRLVSRDAHSLVLEARFNRKTMPLGYVTMATGDRFVETYYTDRWYNVFAIYAG